MTSDVMDSALRFPNIGKQQKRWVSEESSMKTDFSRKDLAVSFFSVLILGVASTAAMADGARGTPEIDNPADVAAIRQIGTAMGDAMVALDIDKLKQIYAEDWMSVAMSGKKMNRDDLFREVKYGNHRLVSYALGPIDVEVLGNVAVAGGRVSEVRNRDGKKVSMSLVYMDFLEKRGGKWLVVRSEGGAAK